MTGIGKVFLNRLPFWKADSFIVEIINGSTKRIPMTRFTNKRNAVADDWEFEGLPSWAVFDEDTQEIVASPPSGLIQDFEVTITYDDFIITITLQVDDGDLVFMDAFGVLWTDANGIAWGEHIE